jgi:DNA polymerase-4
METARLTARYLLLKAASRLRAADGITRHLTLHARFESKRQWSATRRLAPTDDSFPLLAALNTLWPQLTRELTCRDRIRTIGISLDDVKPAAGTQLGLFEPRIGRTLEIARAMDRINARFGRNAVTLGPIAAGRAGRIGTKIAFGRIPGMAEFHH